MNKAALEDLAGVSPDQTLADALAYLEGEGSIVQSPTSGIVHLDPAWLAETGGQPQERPTNPTKRLPLLYTESNLQNKECQNCKVDCIAKPINIVKIGK